MAGLIDLVRGGETGRDSTVLYAHLGGQPALNAYSALFRAAGSRCCPAGPPARRSLITRPRRARP